MAAQTRSRWVSVIRTPVGIVATTLLFIIFVAAAFGPILWSEEAGAIDTGNLFQGPSAQHLVGTDNLGRDILYRVIVATRLSVGMALMAVAIGVCLGLVLGTAPAILGRRAGRLATTGVNIAVAFPGLLLALFFAVIFGIGAKGAVLGVGFAIAPSFARLTQTLVATVEDLDFVSAARIAGLGRFRLLVRHVLPNIAEPLVVNATISAGGSLLAFAGLSFLGLGVQAPNYDWGRLLGEGLTGIYSQPLAASAPAIAVVVAGLAFSLFGEAVAKGFGLNRTTPTAGGAAPVRVAAGAASQASVAGSTRVLDVDNLQVSYPGSGDWISPVRGVSFSIDRGEAVAIVGESGSGKSLTALAIAQLIEEPGIVTADRMLFEGVSLPDAEHHQRQGLLGTSLAMVFQDPMSSLNPTKRVGRQLAEVAQEHQGMSRGQALARAVDRLRAVRVPAAEGRAHQYPHEFSGGMRQRAMIGMGLMGSPSLIVADEPTTALDVTVQRQILRLLAQVRNGDNVAILLISHDITVVSQVCDRVLVMYAGEIVEDLPVEDLADHARHPYTRALLATVPDMHTDRDKPLSAIPGRPVDPANVPTGCAFAARCEFADEQCRQSPQLVADGLGRRVACWHPVEAAELSTTVL